MGKRTVAQALAVYGFAMTDVDGEGAPRAYAHPWEPSGDVRITRRDGSAPASFDDAVVLAYCSDGERPDRTDAFPSAHALLARLREGARTLTVDYFGNHDERGHANGGEDIVHVSWNDRASLHDADGEPLDAGEFDVIAQHPSQRVAILAAIRACVETGESQTVELP